MKRAEKVLIRVVLLGIMMGFAGSLSAQVNKEATTVKEDINARGALTPAEVQARMAWQKTMHNTRAPKQGCFHAAYPSTQWQEVQCAPPPGYRSARPHGIKREKIGIEDVGGTGGGTPLNNDIVVQAPTGHRFSKVTGNFPIVSGVTSVSSVGVPAFGGGGILGANEYTLQINTNTTYSSACGSYHYCTPWQQYVMSTNTPVSISGTALTGKTEVFIEYWLLNYGVDNGTNICPSAYVDGGPDPIGPGDDCVQNTPAAVVYNGQLPITDLADVSLSATATASGTDAATVTYGGNAYTATVNDSATNIASVWNQAEFNVVGNAGGSQAVFNNGASMITKIAVADGSASAPSCVFNNGTTGESNNLNFVPSTTAPVCCPYGGSDPSIEFMQVNDPSHSHTASCGSSSITGEPHITTVNDTYYNFQAEGEFVALRDADGTEIQTRQTALPTLAPGNYDPNNKDNDGLVSCLAMNTAVAAKVGSHRVTYEPSFGGAYGSGPFQLRIDGKVVTPGAQGVILGNGGLVKNASAGSGIEVDFPDGKIMTAIGSGSYDAMKFLNVQFDQLGISADSGGTAQLGIAGDVPKGSWLPALPNGASVGPMPPTLPQRYQELYTTFGNAWRVTKQSTLFDYAPGTSTATFTNTKWPVENAKTCTIPNQKAIAPVSATVAEATCKAVLDPKLHSSCLFDVQATGDTRFAETYKATETVHKMLDIKPIDLRVRQVTSTK